MTEETGESEIQKRKIQETKETDSQLFFTSFFGNRVSKNLMYTLVQHIFLFSLDLITDIQEHHQNLHQAFLVPEACNYCVYFEGFSVPSF